MTDRTEAAGRRVDGAPPLTGALNLSFSILPAESPGASCHTHSWCFPPHATGDVREGGGEKDRKSGGEREEFMLLMVNYNHK